MSLLDTHAKTLKISAKYHGVSVTLEDLDGNQYTDIKVLFNAVEWGIKINDINNPLGEKTNVYIDRDSLQTDDGEIVPDDDWKLIGSPNSYDEDKTYIIEIPKKDNQLPGVLLFLSEFNDEAEEWPEVE